MRPPPRLQGSSFPPDTLSFRLLGLRYAVAPAVEERCGRRQVRRFEELGDCATRPSVPTIKLDFNSQSSTSETNRGSGVVRAWGGLVSSQRVLALTWEHL